MIPALERRLRAVRDGMTPGQRWTAALALCLALALAGFGQPQLAIRRVVVPTRTPRGAAASKADTLPLAQVPIADAGAPPPFAPLGSSPAGMAAPEPSGAVAVPSRSPRVVALAVPASSATPPGRSDADIARAFLPDATVVALDAHATCAALAGTAEVFVASGDVGESLWKCLGESGATVIAHEHFDARGTAVSTRRPLTAALRALGRPSGRVGVAAASRLRHAVEPALASLGAAAVRWVSDTRATADVRSGARAFASAGINTVVFVLPSDEATQWVAQESALSPGVRWIMADAFDAGRTEAFPATFDGARLVTSERGPWSSRAHGDTAEQQRCRQQWEAQAQRTVDTELAAVYSWCQAAALRAGSGGGVDAAALRALRYDSPLTAPLGPVGEGWGPTAQAELTWRAACECWRVVRDFAANRVS